MLDRLLEGAPNIRPEALVITVGLKDKVGDCKRVLCAKVNISR